MYFYLHIFPIYRAFISKNFNNFATNNLFRSLKVANKLLRRGSENYNGK